MDYPDLMMVFGWKHCKYKCGFWTKLNFYIAEFIQSNLERANTMMEEGGDWDRRNRLKVYEGLYSMSIRNFGKAADLFLETVSTFTSYELMDYKQVWNQFIEKLNPNLKLFSEYA